MKIPSTSPALQSAPSTEPADAGRAKASAPGKPQGASGGSDSVQLSQLSTQLHAIESSLSGPEFDRTKVENIKQAIRDGSLTINAGVVADKMLSSARELLSQGVQ